MYRLLILNYGDKSKPQGLEAHSAGNSSLILIVFLFSERGGQWQIEERK